MHIAVNTRLLLPGKLEGIGHYTNETMSRIVRQHPEHQFTFLFDRPFDPRFVYADNVTPKVVFPPARHPFLWWLWFEMAIPRALRQCKADVFLSPDNYCSLRTDVPTVMVLHDIIFEHFPQHIPPLVSRYYRHYVPSIAAKPTTFSPFRTSTKPILWNIMARSRKKLASR